MPAWTRIAGALSASLLTQSILGPAPANAQSPANVQPPRPAGVAPLALRFDPFPKALAENAELLVVAGSEPVGPYSRVFVDRPGKNVILVLASHEKTAWVVEVISGTRLAAVVVGPRHAGSTVATNAGTPAFSTDVGYEATADGTDWRAVLQAIDPSLGKKRIDALRTARVIPAEQLISKLDSTGR